MHNDKVCLYLLYTRMKISSEHCTTLASPSFPSLAVWKSGRGPGIFYHVSNVEGREKVERT